MKGLSKITSWLLRHAANLHGGLDVGGGWMSWTHFVSAVETVYQKFGPITEGVAYVLCDAPRKRRFMLTYRDARVDGIRALHGH